MGVVVKSWLVMRPRIPRPLLVEFVPTVLFGFRRRRLRAMRGFHVAPLGNWARVGFFCCCCCCCRGCCCCCCCCCGCYCCCCCCRCWFTWLRWAIGLVWGHAIDRAWAPFNFCTGRCRSVLAEK